jgi:hypothetical protein
VCVCVCCVCAVSVYAFDSPRPGLRGDPLQSSGWRRRRVIFPCGDDGVDLPRFARIGEMEGTAIVAGWLCVFVDKVGKGDKTILVWLRNVRACVRRAMCVSSDEPTHAYPTSSDSSTDRKPRPRGVVGGGVARVVGVGV